MKMSALRTDGNLLYILIVINLLYNCISLQRTGILAYDLDSRCIAIRNAVSRSQARIGAIINAANASHLYCTQQVSLLLTEIYTHLINVQSWFQRVYRGRGSRVIRWRANAPLLSGRIRKDVPRHSTAGSSGLIGETWANPRERREKRETNGIVPGERSVNDTAGEKGTVSS